MSWNPMIRRIQKEGNMSYDDVINAHTKAHIYENVKAQNEQFFGYPKCVADMVELLEELNLEPYVNKTFDVLNLYRNNIEADDCYNKIHPIYTQAMNHIDRFLTQHADYIKFAKQDTESFKPVIEPMGDSRDTLYENGLQLFGQIGGRIPKILTPDKARTLCQNIDPKQTDIDTLISSLNSNQTLFYDPDV